MKCYRWDSYGFPFFGAHTSPQYVTPLWLQLFQDPLSGTKLLSESFSDVTTVENLIWETRHCWEFHSYKMMDEPEFLRCKELAHLGLSTSVGSVLEGSVLLQCPTNQKTGWSKSQLHFAGVRRTFTEIKGGPFGKAGNCLLAPVKRAPICYVCIHTYICNTFKCHTYKMMPVRTCC